MVSDKWAVWFIWAIVLDSLGEEFWAWQQGARAHSSLVNQSWLCRMGQCCQQTGVVGKPRGKRLCSALLSLPEYGNHRVDASSKQHVAILTSMLQLLKHPGKMDCSCFFCPQQYEAAGKYFWKIQGYFLMRVWDLRVFFLYHTIFTLVQYKHTSSIPFETVFVFFCGFQASIQKRFLHPLKRSFVVWGPGQ